MRLSFNNDTSHIIIRLNLTLPWEQRKLDTITDVRDGTHNSPQYVESGHPFITSKNVKDGFINYEDIQYVSDKDYEEINKRSKVDKNDILMGMIGTIGNIALVREMPDFAIKNVALIKDIGDVFYRYLYHCLQSNSVAQQLDENLDGGTQKFIALNKIRELVISIPSEHEQYKIGDYMELLDHLITLHQRKYDRLTSIKKSMLEKMFPKNGNNVPEIRFKGFTEAWEQRKLGEITDSYSGGTPTAGKTEYYGGGIPFIRSAEVNSDTTELFLTEEGLKNSSAKMTKKGDILYALYGATSGEVGLARLDGAINQAILDIRPHDKFDTPFIMQWLRKSKESIIGTYLQGGQGNLSGTIVTSLMIDCPNYDEQKKIGVYFSTLDHLITLHQRKLEKLKNLKKACLEKMFV